MIKYSSYQNSHSFHSSTLSPNSFANDATSYLTTNPDLLVEREYDDMRVVDTTPKVAILNERSKKGVNSVSEITHTNENVKAIITLLTREFGEKEIIIVKNKSIEDVYENDLEKVNEMAQGHRCYLYEDNLFESQKLFRTIMSVRRTVMLGLTENNYADYAREKKVEKAKMYALDNGKDLVKMRFQEKKIMSFRKMAKILNEEKKLTPSGKGKWAAGNVERIYKNYLKLNCIEEEEVIKNQRRKFNIINSDSL